MNSLIPIKIILMVVLSFTTTLLLDVGPIYLASKPLVPSDMVRQPAAPCEAEDTTTARQIDFFEMNMNCRSASDTTIDYPTLRRPNTSLPSHHFADWVQKQFEPKLVYRFSTDFCSRSSLETDTSGLDTCKMPLDDPRHTFAASLFYVTLRCHKQTTDGELVLQCILHNLSDQIPGTDEAITLRKVDVFVTDEHAIPPAVVPEARFDQVFYDHMFHLVNRLGTTAVKI